MPAPVPPFERFYEAHRDPIFGFLAGRLGRERAEDAFQETFLRALRGYGTLRHGEHLRAWAFTIAARVVVDELRRGGTRAAAEERLCFETPAASGDGDDRPAFAELEHLTAALPPKERAAVVLRYGYDLTYEQIGEALGSSEDAARQAASSGVRRLRREEAR